MEHDLWTYVHFLVYLRRKDKTELTGVEYYVWEKLKKLDLSWVPVRSSAAIQAANTTVAEESDGSFDSKAIERALEDLKSELMDHLQNVEDKIQGLPDELAGQSSSM